MSKRRKKRRPAFAVWQSKKEMRKVHVTHQNNECVYCSCQMTHIPDHPKQATLEHVIPSCFFGRHNLRNTVAACAECNRNRNENLPTLAMIINLIKVRKWKTIDIAFELVHWYLSINLIKLIVEVNYAVSKIETAQSHRGEQQTDQQAESNFGQEGQVCTI